MTPQQERRPCRGAAQGFALFALRDETPPQQERAIRHAEHDDADARAQVQKLPFWQFRIATSFFRSPNRRIAPGGAAMSWQAKQWAEECLGRLGLRGKARKTREDVFRKLADRHNMTQDPWPSVETQARDAGCSDRAVRRALRFWEGTGLLATVRRGRQTSIYVLRLDRLPPPPAAKSSAKRAAESSAKRANRPANASESSDRAARNRPPNPDVLNPEEEPRESRACARAPTTPPRGEDSSSEEAAQSGIERPARSPERPARRRGWSALPPDDWEPEPEAVADVFAEGFGPDDLPTLRNAMFDWHRRSGRGSCDWDRELVAEARHHAEKRRRESRQPASGPPRAKLGTLQQKIIAKLVAAGMGEARP